MPRARRRAVGFADCDRTVEADDRRVGEPEELVVPLHDLNPVGLLDTRRVGTCALETLLQHDRQFPLSQHQVVVQVVDLAHRHLGVVRDHLSRDGIPRMST